MKKIRLLPALIAVLPAVIQSVPCFGTGEGDGYTHNIATAADFEKFSVTVTSPPGVERETKFLAPSSDDPNLLSTLFQNVNLYQYHLDFLTTEFPDRFPGFGSPEYLTLVERRATRTYYAGIVFRFKGNPAPIYGFDVFTLFGDPTELPTLAETRWIHQQLSAAFSLGTLAYSPRDPVAAQNAKGWVDPGFDIYYAFGNGSADYIAYTLNENYGRVRILDEKGLEAANESGEVSSQDILVLDVAPSDIQGVIAGVLTATIQDELSHLSIRMGRRGTPNAYVKDARTKFTPFEGKLVRLSVTEDGATMEDANLADAEAWWKTHRPPAVTVPAIIPDYDQLDAAEEMPFDGSLVFNGRYGGKATNFGRLWHIVPSEHHDHGFGIPISYYVNFMRNNKVRSRDGAQLITLEDYVKELIQDPAFRGDSHTRFVELGKLQDLIENEGVVDPALVLKVDGRIKEVFGTTMTNVRFRSSSNAEHLLEFNGAGLYESTHACAADDFDSGTGGPSLCDPTETNERGVARALRRVWASLWTFRGFEEREYSQIPQTGVGMGILVSDSFGNFEQANAVAFTGNPALRGDGRFYVNCQLGDTEVVLPPPGVKSELDLLEMENGLVKRIIRSRASSLVPAGKFVLSEDQLKEVGRVMAIIQRDFPFDPGSHAPDEILRDIEFKITKDGALIFKDVRLYVIPSNGVAPTEFHVTVPEGIVLCSSFREGRVIQEVLHEKAQVALKAGVMKVLSVGVSEGELFDWVQFSPGGPRFTPRAPGRWTTERQGSPPGTNLRLSQDFDINGELFTLALTKLFFDDSGPKEALLDQDGLTWAINPYFTHVESAYPNDEDPIQRATWYLPCDLSHLNVYNVDAVFRDFGRVRFQERFQDVLDGTGPAELIGAEVDLAGQKQTVSDYWRLVYTAGHHNDQPYPEHWAILDPPIDVPGVGRAKVMRAWGGFKGDGGEPDASLLDENFQTLKVLDLVLFRRQREGAPEIAQFRRGDANSSGNVNITDAIAILLYMFEGTEMACADAADVDDIGTVEVDDAILLLQYLFFDLDPPTNPGPLRCGIDVEPDDLPDCDGKACR